MANITSPDPTHTPKMDLPDKFSELKVEDILSCAKIEHAPQPPQTLNDIELADLDAKIAAKLEELKTRTTALLTNNGSGEGSRWVLREETGTEKRRWLVARNVENEVELTVDLVELEAKSDQI